MISSTTVLMLPLMRDSASSAAFLRRRWTSRLTGTGDLRARRGLEEAERYLRGLEPHLDEVLLEALLQSVLDVKMESGVRAVEVLDEPREQPLASLLLLHRDVGDVEDRVVDLPEHDLEPEAHV